MSIQLQGEAEARFPYLTTAGNDHKCWAKRIMYRQERGDKTLTTLQINFARAALNIDQNDKEREGND